MTTTLDHPNLGLITGLNLDGVVQFRGVKYASLRDRFATAELLTDYGHAGIDATKFGPQILSNANNVDAELELIQHVLPKPDHPGVSDIDGLNLNITVPKDSTGESAQKKLPVLVFVHGGGFQTGSNWWPQWDFGRLVKLSVEHGAPMIGIGISYRLGVPGFLTSEEMRSAGYASNNGLRDQRTALRWVQRCVSGFGGDPENVTVMGQSAGGISTALLLCSEEPFAKRLICLGGSPPMVKPLDPPIAEYAYGTLVDILGLKALSATERIQALTKMSAEELLAKTPSTLPVMPVLDGELIPGMPSFTAISSKEVDKTYQMPGKEWCKCLFVGDSGLDSSIFASMSLEHRKAGILDAFERSLRKSLDNFPSTASAILQAYELTSNLDDDAALIQILKFANDVAFLAPAVSMACGFPGEAYLFHFNEENPWEGPFKGHTPHILDVAFLFQNFNDYLSADQAAAAKQFGKDVITFVAGEAPWKAFRADEKKVGVYGGGTRQVLDAFDDMKTGRRDVIFKLSESCGLDVLLDAWLSFLFGA